MARYVFSRSYDETFNDLFWKKKIEFKLFEDIEPTIKSLDEMIPKVFSDQNIQDWKNDTKHYDPKKLAIL